MKKTLITVALLELMIGAAAGVKASETGIRDGTFVAPRIPWAKPLAGGSIKTLAIVPVGGSRNLWELAEALDLELEVFMVQNAGGRFGSRAVFGIPSRRYWGFLYDDQLAKAREAFSRQYDLIILANVCLSSLPPEIAYRLSAQVTAGAGLVMTNARINDPLLESLYTREPVGDDAMDVLQPLPFAALDAGGRWTEGQSPIEPLGAVKPYDLHGRFKAYTVGKGRFITLPFPFEGTNWGAYASVPALIPGIFVNMANRWQEDYYYGMVAKACLWAVGREPTVGIGAVSPQGDELAIGDQPVVTVTLTGTAGFSGRLEYELRDAITHHVIARGGRDVTTEAAETAVSFIADALPVAKTFIIVRLRDQAGAVMDFGGGFLEVECETPLKLSLDRDTFHSPEPISGAIALPPELAGADIELTLFDSRARIWVKTTVAAAQGETRFSLPSERNPLVVNGLRAVAVKDGLPVAVADVFLTIRQPRAPFYVTISDEAWPTWNTLRRLERTYEWGADGLRDHKSGGHPIPRQPDANSVNQAIVNAIAGLDHNPGRPHIWAHLPFNQELVAQIEQAGRRNSHLYYPYNQAIYNTTDDCGPNLSRFVPDSFPMFLAYLDTLYGSIAALNTEWETAFASLADIPPEFVAAAREDGPVAVWSDYLRFAGDAYLDSQRRYRDAIRAVDPRAASGCDAVYYGTSLVGLYRELGYIMPYYRPWLVHFGRSLAKGEPPVYTGICAGVYAYYSGTEPLNRRMPWHVLLAGNNAFFFWSLLVGFEGDLSTGGEQLIGWMMDEVSRIKLTGAAQWILAADRAPAQAAILYSEESRRAETSVDREFSLVEAACTSFQEMLEDQGIAYNYIATECIVEDNVLDDPNLKLLILPASTAMSHAESTAIRAFVQRGGTVWADIDPAVRSGQGRLLPRGRLDDLFGVARTGAADKRDLEFAFPGQAAMQASADDALRLDGGEAALEFDGTPLFIRHRQGEGMTILFNLDPAFYGAGRGTGSDAERGTLGRNHAPAAASHAFIGGLLAEAGLPPRPASLAGGPPVGLTRYAFAKGDGKLLAVEVKPVDGMSYPANVRLPLGGRFQVHELRSGRQWPATDAIEFDASPNDVFVFSLLPGPPATPTVDTPTTAMPGETLAIRAAANGAPHTTLFAFSLITPDGRASRDYMRQVATDNGLAAAAIALPYNAASGDWTLEAKNLLTGGMVRKTIHVKENDQ